MKKGKFFAIYLHIYPIYVHVSIGQSDAEWIRSIRRSRIPKQSADAILTDDGDIVRDVHAGFVATGPGGYVVLRLFTRPKDDDDFGHLSHEIFHMVQSVMEFVGCPLSVKSCEPWAYLTGYITTEIYKRL